MLNSLKAWVGFCFFFSGFDRYLNSPYKVFALEQSLLLRKEAVVVISDSLLVAIVRHNRNMGERDQTFSTLSYLESDLVHCFITGVSVMLDRWDLRG